VYSLNPLDRSQGSSLFWGKEMCKDASKVSRTRNDDGEKKMAADKAKKKNPGKLH
jgi:hypothetical protein